MHTETGGEEKQKHTEPEQGPGRDCDGRLKKDFCCSSELVLKNGPDTAYDYVISLHEPRVDEIY